MFRWQIRNSSEFDEKKAGTKMETQVSRSGALSQTLSLAKCAPDYYILTDSGHNGDSQKHDVFILAFIDDLRTFSRVAA